MGNLKIGDKAIVKVLEITMGGFEIGEEVAIVGPSHASPERFKIAREDGYTGYCDPSSLKPVTAKFKVGDRVMVTGGLYEGLATVDELSIGGCMLNTDGPHRGHLPCGRLWKSSYNLTLAVEEIEVGDTVKVIGNGSQNNRATILHSFNTGTVGKVKELYGADQRGPAVVVEAEGRTQYITTTDVELVVEKIEVGDKVKVIEMAPPMLGFRLGDIVTVLDLESNGDFSVKIEHSNGYAGYTDIDKLELVEKAVKHEVKSENETEADEMFKVTHVKAIEGGYDITEGTVYEVVKQHSNEEWTIIDDAGDEQNVDTTEVTPFVEEPKKHIRMTNNDPAGGFKAGDILEVKDARNFIDRDGDIRPLRAHKHEFVAFSEKQTTKNDVVAYLKELSADEVIAIIKEAR
jgi:ribosomal protein L21E